IVVNAFYALQDTKTPVRMAIISVIAKIVFSVILMQWLAHGGLALSTALASMLNFGLLTWALRKKLGVLGSRGITASIFKTTICSLVMGAVVWAVALFIIPSEGATLAGLFFGLMGSIFTGIVLYGFFAFLFKSPELEKILAFLFHRKAAVSGNT
ncbi:MAG: polysaccharide biosynthesis C-terminal domain-containing protein, partial [Desulfobacterales bacterium]|nr:polysaccharide biosynthesis C-terminal domain-containing protein [Desulfobacterales bacterium]